jgi:hypothetical protein
MNWFYSVSQSNRLAGLWLLLMVVILGGMFIEKLLVTRLNVSFSSIYKDRLVPAAEIFHINDLMYSKKFRMETFLLQSGLQPAASQDLAEINQQLDSILHAYEMTYLVETESQTLNTFKAKLSEYNQLEDQLLQEATNADTRHWNNLFNQIRLELIALSDIQTIVGQELLQRSDRLTAGVKLVNYLQLSMILIIGLSVHFMLMQVRSTIPGKPQKFRLN